MPQQIISINEFLKSFLFALGKYDFESVGLDDKEFIIDGTKQNLESKTKIVMSSTFCTWRYFSKEKQEELMKKYNIEYDQIVFNMTFTFFKDDETKVYIDPDEIDLEYIKSLKDQFGFYSDYINGVEPSEIGLKNIEVRRLVTLNQLEKRYSAKA